jgi:bifunctional DNA-binding transcriptional regulator/antitoxin component of YhaV-PrlF toxin-antitoxin module
MQQVIIKPLAKGQITIPALFRRQLGVSTDTLFQAQLTKEGIFLKPISLDWREKYIRQFSKNDMQDWVETDMLDKKTLSKIKKYFK